MTVYGARGCSQLRWDSAHRQFEVLREAGNLQAQYGQSSSGTLWLQPEEGAFLAARGTLDVVLLREGDGGAGGGVEGGEEGSLVHRDDVLRAVVRDGRVPWSCLWAYAEYKKDGCVVRRPVRQAAARVPLAVLPKNAQAEEGQLEATYELHLPGGRPFSKRAARPPGSLGVVTTHDSAWPIPSRLRRLQADGAEGGAANCAVAVADRDGSSLVFHLSAEEIPLARNPR